MKFIPFLVLGSCFKWLEKANKDYADNLCAVRPAIKDWLKELNIENSTHRIYPHPVCVVRFIWVFSSYTW